MALPTDKAYIKNPNPDGRSADGIGIVPKGETVEVTEAQAVLLADGNNFVRVDGPAVASESQEDKQPTKRPKTPTT